MKGPAYVYAARVERVIDGDTIDLRVDLGFHVEIGIRTRLLDYDAPEISTPAGKAARDWLRAYLPPGSAATVATFRDPGDKYGRWLAIITTPDGDLRDMLRARGYVKVPA